MKYTHFFHMKKTVPKHISPAGIKQTSNADTIKRRVYRLKSIHLSMNENVRINMV